VQALIEKLNNNIRNYVEERQFNYLKEETKAWIEIITNAVKSYEKSKNTSTQSQASADLHSILKNANLTLEVKRSRINDYCLNTDNQNRRFYEILKRAISRSNDFYQSHFEKKSKALYRMYIFDDDLPRFIPLMVWAPLLSFFPILHGIHRAATRKPLGQEQQTSLIQMLNTRLTDKDKEDLISGIVQRYSRERSFAHSQSSTELFNILKGDTKIDAKWQKIQQYMRRQDNDGYYYNNGKKLFIIINDMLTQKINQPETHRVSTYP
jgi:hypothetical protein